MRNILSILLLITPFSVYSQDTTANNTPILIFRFLHGDDMFYAPVDNNKAELNNLYSLVDEYITDILDGNIFILVDAYCSASKREKRNLDMAFFRANRVKSELITNKGLSEEHFITNNYTTDYQDKKEVVTVTLYIPVKEIQHEKPELIPEPEPQPQPQIRPKPEEQLVHRPQLQPDPIPTPVYPRWSVGANLGVPLFWGDMTSIAYDKTYIGVMFGVQVSYQVIPLLNITASLDWAHNKAGSRNYARDYQLDESGMTWYTPQSFSTKAYEDIYSKINMYSLGLHLDINMNRLFGPKTNNSRLKFIASPAVYAQYFFSKIHTKSDKKVYIGDRLSKGISLGLGGDLILRYDFNKEIDFQLKGTGMWITDNSFDNINTVGYIKMNAMFGVSAGIIWKINNK